MIAILQMRQRDVKVMTILVKFSCFHCFPYLFCFLAVTFRGGFYP